MHNLFCSKVNQFVSLCALSILFLALPLSKAQSYPLDKKLFLAWVGDRMEKTNGLSGQFFSIGNIPYFLKTVDGYLNGVHVDPDYLSRLASSNTTEWLKSFFVNLDPDQGYTQGRGADAHKHPSELPGYDGTVILVDLDSLDNATAFHEAIHAFAFARRLGDLDRDEYGGPEYISKGFIDLLGRLRMIDRRIETLAEKAYRGQDIDAEGKRLVNAILLTERNYRSDATPEMQALLKRMGGFADFYGYRLAVGRILDKAVQSGKFREPATDFFQPYPNDGNSKPCQTPASIRRPKQATLIYHCRIPYGCGERCSTSVRNFRPEDGYTKVRDTGKPCTICPKGYGKKKYNGSDVCVQCQDGKRFRDGCCY